MKSMFLSVLFLGVPFAEGLAFQHSAALRVAEVSRARCVKIPESCVDGIDEMIETATIIKEEGAMLPCRVRVRLITTFALITRT